MQWRLLALIDCHYIIDCSISVNGVIAIYKQLEHIFHITCCKSVLLYLTFRLKQLPY